MPARNGMMKVEVDREVRELAVLPVRWRHLMKKRQPNVWEKSSSQYWSSLENSMAPLSLVLFSSQFM